jgi:hypothetical protein
MLTARSKRPWPRFLAAAICSSGAGVVAVACGFSGAAPATGTGGASTTPGAGNSSTNAGTSPMGGSSVGAGGMGTVQGGNGTTAGTNGNAGSRPTGGGDTGGTGAMIGGTNLEYTGTWPNAPIKYKTMPGQLKYTKKVIHTQFLAESCSIADYNNDGVPDVSSGRIWYQGPDFVTQHPFRDGHGALPRNGTPRIEINTGVSDDWADYPFDVNHDGNTDIINIAQCDVPETTDTNPKIGTVQPHASAYWYQNPGPAGQAGDPKWTPHLIHADVRLEQHGFLDINADGFPEIFGACSKCTPNETKGYYQADPANPNNPWLYHAVTQHYTFPFNGLGWMHGMGGGDLNGDGKVDIVERDGAWLQQADGSFNQTPCTAKGVPAGCGFVRQDFYDGVIGAGQKGASHMYAVDMDMDGIADVVAADWAHGEGLFWYKQGADGKFTKYKFMGNAGEKAAYGAYFTEPHALQVADMDGDGRPDVVTGKMRFAHPKEENDPDPTGVPYIYVFKNVAAKDPNSGAPITLQPVRVDGVDAYAATGPGSEGTPEAGMGVGRQLAVGHVNTDGILDICVGTKVGLAVFIGQ